MVTLMSEKSSAACESVAVTLEVHLSRVQLTAALYDMPDPDPENLATVARVRQEVACALMSGSGTPDDLAHVGRFTARAYAAGRLDPGEASWWSLCWSRIGEVFFGEKPPRPIRLDRVPDLSATPLAVAFGATA